MNNIKGQSTGSPSKMCTLSFKKRSSKTSWWLKKTPEFSCITRTLVIEPIFFILKHSIFYKPIKIKNVKNFDKSKKHRGSNCQLELIRINQGHVCDFLGYFEAILRLQVQLRASINLNLFISKPKFEFQIS